MVNGTHTHTHTDYSVYIPMRNKMFPEQITMHMQVSRSPLIA